MKYEPLCGTQVDDCIKKICELAKQNQTTVTAKFNDFEFTATPETTIDELEILWYASMGTTKDEFKRKTEQYPDIKEWLRRWDAGETVWTVEMGGLGPGYEQALQIAAVEMVRILVDSGIDATSETYAIDAKELIDKKLFAVPLIKNLGISGGQFGAAINIADQLYRRTPSVALADEQVKDRKILISKNFPQG